MRSVSSVGSQWRSSSLHVGSQASLAVALASSLLTATIATMSVLRLSIVAMLSTCAVACAAQPARPNVILDLAADSGERTDLAAHHPDLVERLKKQYDAWFDDVCSRWSAKQD